MDKIYALLEQMIKQASDILPEVFQQMIANSIFYSITSFIFFSIVFCFLLKFIKMLVISFNTEEECFIDKFNFDSEFKKFALTVSSLVFAITLYFLITNLYNICSAIFTPKYHIIRMLRR